jgi:hypothetical protein
LLDARLADVSDSEHSKSIDQSVQIFRVFCTDYLMYSINR